MDSASVRVSEGSGSAPGRVAATSTPGVTGFTTGSTSGRGGSWAEGSDTEAVVGVRHERTGWAVGRKLSDNYDFGEPGKWGEDPELIDDVEGDDDDDDD